MRCDIFIRSIFFVEAVVLFLTKCCSFAYQVGKIGTPLTHRLLLVRHGDSIWNGGQPGCYETFTGWTDVQLSDKGKQEAVDAGKEIALSYKYDIDICATSLLSRAQKTATAIIKAHPTQRMKTIVDYRLNERHYGALQGYIKKEVEEGKYGHDPADVELWRRSWHTVPPLLDHSDPRRIKELDMYAEICGGPDYIPRGESLAMVAKNRIRPFLHNVLTPFLDQASEERLKKSRVLRGSTALIVAHANSLRALIGVICEVEEDQRALSILESLKLPTGLPLVLQYQRNLSSSGKIPRFKVEELPEASECIVDFDDIDGGHLANDSPSDLGHPKLPVWPLNQCLPVEEILFRQKSLVRLRQRVLR